MRGSPPLPPPPSSSSRRSTNSRSVNSSSTIGRASVAVKPRGYRPRQVPSIGASTVTSIRKVPPLRRKDRYYEEGEEQSYDKERYGQPVRRERQLRCRYVEENVLEDYDKFATWTDQRRRNLPGRKPQQYFDDDSGLSYEIDEDEYRYSEELEQRDAPPPPLPRRSRLHPRRMDEDGSNSNDVPNTRRKQTLPTDKRQQQNVQKNTVGMTQNVPINSPAVSVSTSSTASSGPKYPGDGDFNMGEEDWADFPTQKSDPDLKNIRRQFLSQNSSLSSKSSRSAMKRHKSHRRKKLVGDEPKDMEGLPPGFYRRKDGVILSFDSSADSSSELYRRYESSGNISLDIVDEEETKMESSLGETDYLESLINDPIVRSRYQLAELADDYSAHDETDNQESTINDSNTQPRFQEEDGDNSIHESTVNDTIENEGNQRNESLVTALVRSFEEQMEQFRTGFPLTGVEDRVKERARKERAKVREPSVSSKNSNSSSIRRAKVKGYEEQKSPGPTTEGKPLLSREWELDSDTHEYDDSTITTRESQMKNRKAIIEMNPYEIDADGGLDPPKPNPTRIQEDAENSLLLLQRYKETQQQLYEHQTVPAEHVDKEIVGEKRVGFGGVFPEPTRGGYRVPELVSRDTVMPGTVVSDISSHPKSKESIDSSKYGHDGVNVTDNVTGFIDKMALALRLAVFQPASSGCK